VTFSIWDTASHERFRNLSLPFYKGVHAAIIVYDITQQDSLRNAGEWLDILLTECSSNIFKALAGNKADLVSQREVTYEVICVCSYRITSGIKSVLIKSNSVSPLGYSLRKSIVLIGTNIEDITWMR